MSVRTYLGPLVALAAAAIATGCADETRLGPPRPEAITPGIGFLGSEVAATITGRDFYVDPRVSYVDGDGTDVDAVFRAFLGSAELPSVTRVDLETLEVVVPGTLAAGFHELRVIDPRGREGRLPDAFEVLPCFLVTTDADEDDAGESPTPPHQGSGLSLREAIGLANEVDESSACIRFAAPMTITLGAASLPDFSGPAAIDFDGTGVVLDGTAMQAAAAGLDFNAPGATVTGVRLQGFTAGDGIAIRFRGAGSTARSCEIRDGTVGFRFDGAGGRVEGCVVRNMGYMGVNLRGPDAVVTGNTFTDIGSYAAAVGVESGGDRAAILDNVFVRAVAGVYLDSVADVRIDHGTFHDGAVAVYMDSGSSGVTGTRIRNSIISNMSFRAVQGDDTEISELDWVTFFSNNDTPCSGCTLGPSCDLADPDYADEANDDLSLAAGSPAIDSGTDLGLDVNGSAAGLFNGTAPDRGGLESP